jgi:LacI family transcriptional regulator
MKKPTLKSIANRINVSTVAVFKALNNQPGVSDELRQSIKDVAKELGYVNKSSRQGLNNKKFLFFIKPNFFLTPSEQFYSNIFYYLNAECAANNSTLQVSFIENGRNIAFIEKAIANFKPDGVFFGCEITEDIFSYVDKLLIPTLFIDYYSPLFSQNYVYVDNYRVAYLLTRYLLTRGHKQIGFIGDISKTTSIADRYFGYLKALKEANINVDNNWHINVNIEHSLDLVDIHPETNITAYVCHCDSAAQRLYTLLSLKGLKVPRDVSVVSFDNTPLCENLIPKLTSIGPNKETYARRALQAMSEAMRGKRTIIQIKSLLAERDSVCTIE